MQARSLTRAYLDGYNGLAPTMRDNPEYVARYTAGVIQYMEDLGIPEDAEDEEGEGDEIDME